MMIEATKFYVRHREGYPELEMQDAARRGFLEQGVEVAPYEWIDDVDERMPDLGPTVGVAGYIGDVWRALRKLARPLPEPVDYPEPLHEFLGRGVRRTTLGEVARSTASVFVKSVEHKVLSGFVWRGAQDAESRRRIVTLPDIVPVWVSEPIPMRSEYRCFILDGELLDVRRYKGDWSLAPDRDRVEAMVHAWRDKPRACCIDVALVERYEGHPHTVLVEANDGFAFGHYGLSSVLYARMLSARWHQLVIGEP